MLGLWTLTCPALLHAEPRPEPEIERYCHTRALTTPQADRGTTEATCRTLVKGAADAFAARLIPEAVEQLRRLEAALAKGGQPTTTSTPRAPRKATKTHDLTDPWSR